MARRKDTTNLGGMLFQSMGTEDPMLSVLDWLCHQLMAAEISNKIGAEKHEQSEERRLRTVPCLLLPETARRIPRMGSCTLGVG